jgi:Kef-type K+ transport system membrane component KefB
MLAGAVLIFFMINAYGSRLHAPEPATVDVGSRQGATGKPDVLLHVLVALTAVLIVGQVLGVCFRWIGQPPVIGEVVGGILLGPTVLGRIWPEAAEFVLPVSVAPYLGVIAQLGVIFYMFLVGLELNPAILRQHARSTIAISHASIVFPFILGSALALVLYPRLSTSNVPFSSFALFVGVAMSITAFPVLARILKDRAMQQTELGVLALGCAATDDVTAWCLLAFVVGYAQARFADAALTLALTVAFIGFMFLVVRPIVDRYLRRAGDIQMTQGLVALVFAGLMLSALTTETIGVHSLFGAFLLGAVIPHHSAIARAFIARLEDLVTVLLLPAYFAFTGMRTQIGLSWAAEQWLLCGLIIMVACVGKFGGTLVAARLTGLGWRDATALGLLMNTRGLMELIALNIGLDMKIISSDLFASMVLMALVTTMATAPLLRRFAVPGEEKPAQSL